MVHGRLKPEGDRPVLDGHADLLEDRVHVLTDVLIILDRLSIVPRPPAAPLEDNAESGRVLHEAASPEDNAENDQDHQDDENRVQHGILSSGHAQHIARHTKTRPRTDRVHQWLSAAQVATIGPRLVAFRYLVFYILIITLIS